LGAGKCRESAAAVVDAEEKIVAEIYAGLCEKGDGLAVGVGAEWIEKNVEDFDLMEIVAVGGWRIFVEDCFGGCVGGGS